MTSAWRKRKGVDHDEEGFRDGTSCRDGDDDRHLHAGRERDHEGHHEGDRAGERNRTATMGLKRWPYHSNYH